MAEDIPTNLTQEFITKIWQSYYKDPNLTITDFKIGLVGAKGDNYSSIMCRAECNIHTNGQTFPKPLVIKTLPTGAGMLKAVKENLAFEKETTMLTKIAPALEKILATAGITKKFAAEVYYHNDNFTIAMEDLSLTGFSVGNRQQGLSLENCLSVAKTLAEFHAASMVYQKNEKIPDEFLYGMISPSSKEMFGRSLRDGFKTITDNIDNWSSVKWSDKLTKVLGKLPNVLFDTIVDIKPNRPLVLNHGDLWLNNIMFRPNSELRFVDLQLSWIQSPVFDLLYFIFTSPSPDIRMKKMEEILKTYHNRFTEVAKLLKCPINYSYEEFQQDLQERLMFGFLLFAYIFPIIVADKEDAMDTTQEDFVDVMKNNPVFANKFFQKSFLEALPFFEERGVFQ